MKISSARQGRIWVRKEVSEMENGHLINQTIAYIEENLQYELNLDQIAQAMHYSKFHLNRLFAETVGCTIYKYIQMRRLTLAAKKLVETNLPIVDIAYEANYCSQQAFMHAFKQLYDHTPKAYRTLGIFHPKQMPYFDLSKEMGQTNRTQEVLAA